MRKLLLGTAVLALTASGSAFAADIPVKAVKAPIVAPVEYSWTGCYLGINGGGKWARDNALVNTTPVGVAGAAPTIGLSPLPLNDTPSTWVAGFQGGCQYQTGHVVFGIEGDFDWNHWNGDRTVSAADLVALRAPLFIPGDTFSITSRWQGSLRGRLGWAWDRFLIYGTGGIGFTSVDFTSNWIPTVAGGFAFPGTFVDDRQTLAGPTVGAGFEYAFWNNVSLGVEGRYTWYGSHTFNNGAVAAIATGTPAAPVFIFSPTSSSINLNTWEVTARLNWRFNWWAPTPVVSKY